METGLIEKLIDFRKELHKYPEESFHEHGTQKRILHLLSSFGIKGEKIADTGVYVLFDSGQPGITIMLRSDHDALAIHETNTFEHTSEIPGLSHMCGHDGHTTIMAGVAAHFHKNPPVQGKLLLIFQPAEEIGEGAKAILNDVKFNWKPDLVFAMHNLPGYPRGQVVYREGNFTAAVKSIIIKLDGKTSHAAEPELGRNPSKAIAELIHMFEEVSQPDLDTDHFSLATPIYIHMGEKSYGISAGHGEIHYTLRTWNRETMNALTERVLEKVDQICEKYQLKSTFSWTEEFSSNRNDPQAVRFVKEAAEELGLSLDKRRRPFKWGEDFGLFTQRYKGAMFGVGAGEEYPALHNPDYDFPDEIIDSCVNLFIKIVEKSVHE